MVVVKDLLQEKGGEIYHVTQYTSVRDALRLMAEKQIGAVLVMEGGRPEGVFSERDLARRLIQSDECSLDIPVKELMTSPVIKVNLTSTLDECMDLMSAKHVRHLPVIENDQVVGIISIGDIVKAVINNHLKAVDRLENYIAGDEH